MREAPLQVGFDKALLHLDRTRFRPDANRGFDLPTKNSSVTFTSIIYNYFQYDLLFPRCSSHVVTSTSKTTTITLSDSPQPQI